MARRASFLWFLVGLLLAGFGAPARAAPILGQPLSLCVARALPGDHAGAMFDAAARFDCHTPQRAWGPGDYWLLARALPARVGEERHWHLRFASLWQRRVDVVARFADGSFHHVALDGVGISRHLRPGAMVEVEPPTRVAPLTGLLWHVEGAANLRGIVRGPLLATEQQAFAADLTMTAIYAGFAALCLTLLVYNLALLLAMRHRFQIAYCVMVAALLGYSLSSSGALAWILPGLANNDRMRINYLMLALSGSEALVFARFFFEPRVFAGWLARAVPVIVAGQLAAALLYLFVAPVGIGLIDRLYCWSLVPLLAMVVPVLWRAWRLRSEVRWLFALAWSAPVLMSALRTAVGFGLLPWSLLVDQSTVVSMSLEALLSSVAVAYRIRLIARERDRAREGEVRALLLADTDPLTGLLNRRAFLRHAIGRAGEQALALADVDHFKGVNDALGHDGGDEVLRLVARALRAAAPPGALVARIGGEEFAVLGTADAPPDPETLLATVRGQRMPFDLDVTISLGTCAGPLGDEAAWKMLYRRADAALFAAKAGGRDRARGADLCARVA